MSGTADNILVVLEPEVATGEPTGDETSHGSAAIDSEAVRIAQRLDAELHRVTWEAAPDTALESVAAAVADAAERRHASAVLLADTDLGRQLAPLVANRLGSAAVVGCTDVLPGRAAVAPPVGSESEDPAKGSSPVHTVPRFVKPVYGGWLEEEIEPVPGTVPVATLEVAGLPVPNRAGEEPPVPELLGVESQDPLSVRRLELLPPDYRSVDIVHARRIVAAGSGSASETLLTAVRELADLLEGSVGATRPVTDEGYLPKERLIGQTGRTVSPELYVALGISGSPHHVAGVRGAERILSVNRDPRAPIFQFSDIGFVGDLEAVLPALVERIKEWRDDPE